MSWRALRRNPGFSLIAIATLAFGIGANTSYFHGRRRDPVAASGLWRRKPPVCNSRLSTEFGLNAPLVPVNAMYFLEWREPSGSLSRLHDRRHRTEPEPELETRNAWRAPVSRQCCFRCSGARNATGPHIPGRKKISPAATMLCGPEPIALERCLLPTATSLDARFCSTAFLMRSVLGVTLAEFHFPRLNQLYAMKVSEDQPEFWKPSR